ncbi:hypothetical protein GUJ93_ZPchr0013g36893 [Zizania palustris]|uniref:Uncharacterized protein n=1 Tax=Zizania palustris TaxID=103762 RepID=A0A8J6C0M0_ZIZPA|nr:hypothetical protein GUJ93_ZPchr0013g36893 [Zizania palustris]
MRRAPAGPGPTPRGTACEAVSCSRAGSWLQVRNRYVAARGVRELATLRHASERCAYVRRAAWYGATGQARWPRRRSRELVSAVPGLARVGWGGGLPSLAAGGSSLSGRGGKLDQTVWMVSSFVRCFPLIDYLLYTP